MRKSLILSSPVALWLPFPKVRCEAEANPAVAVTVHSSYWEADVTTVSEPSHRWLLMARESSLPCIVVLASWCNLILWSWKIVQKDVVKAFFLVWWALARNRLSYGKSWYDKGRKWSYLLCGWARGFGLNAVLLHFTVPKLEIIRGYKSRKCLCSEYGLITIISPGPATAASFSACRFWPRFTIPILPHASPFFQMRLFLSKSLPAKGWLLERVLYFANY